MQKHHLIAAVLAFMMIIISVYFGIRIYNANQNFLISHLNELDHIHYDDVELVPALSRLAGIVTAPFVIAILVFQLLLYKGTTHKKVKNITIGLSVAIVFVLIANVMTLVDPVQFEFSKWGFIWICMGLIILAGNLLSVAIYKFSK